MRKLNNYEMKADTKELQEMKTSLIEQQFKTKWKLSLDVKNRDEFASWASKQANKQDIILLISGFSLSANSAVAFLVHAKARSPMLDFNIRKTQLLREINSTL